MSPPFSDLRNLAPLSPFPSPAANYSMPVVSGPSQDEEFIFTCTSTNGYPRPNVYWINKTDNSLLDDTLQNSTVSLNAQGLYNVVSVLRIGRSPTVDVGCCIENVLLHQNLTSSQTGKVPGSWLGPGVTWRIFSGGRQSPSEVTRQRLQRW